MDLWIKYLTKASNEYEKNTLRIFFFKVIQFLFIYFRCVGSSSLCEGFLQLRQVGATPHRGARAFHYCGLSCCGAQAPDAQAHGPSRSAACGILPDQGSNPCPPHWQADPQPLRHQGSPEDVLINELINSVWCSKAKICIYHSLNLISLYLLELFSLKINCQGDSEPKH